MKVYVRLKPYNKKKGHLLRRYALPSGKVYRASYGWYLLEEVEASDLRGVHQNPEDSDTPLAFDICTKAEAVALARKEHLEEERQRQVRIAISSGQALGALTVSEILGAGPGLLELEPEVPAPPPPREQAPEEAPEDEGEEDEGGEDVPSPPLPPPPKPKKKRVNKVPPRRP